MKMILSEALNSQYVRGDLAVLNAESKTASNGAYAQLKLTDGQREIIGKRWKYSGALPEVGSVLQVVAEVGEYKGVKDLNIKTWTPGETPAEEFERQGPMKSEDLWTLLNETIEGVLDTDYKGVLEYIFREYEEMIRTAVAAKTVHHDYKGGWMQHTIEVTECAEHLAATLQSLGCGAYNPELLVTGALLHDIGKLYTYQCVGSAIEMTDVGQFMEHIIAGCIIIDQVCGALNVPVEKKNLLLHCIASHHENLEWGSPVKPVIPEAMLIHLADQASAKCTIVSNERLNTENDWTNKNFFIGSRIYNGKY